MIDEFDQLLNLSSSMNGNQTEGIVKELQILLDGVHEYNDVHLV
jgi:SpoVK/Ycf46/Vps4 family AAA+-type ATPase